MAKQCYLKGDLNHTGPIEIPDGVTLRQVVEEFGCGMKNGRAFKAMQIGGPSGGLITAAQLDEPLDFKVLAKYGIRRADGVLYVLDEDNCIVDVCYRFMEATQGDFCGKCVPCREGTKRMTELLDDLLHCKLDNDGLALLSDLGEMISVTSFCALGKGCFHTLETAMREFPEEFAAHMSGRCVLCEKKAHAPILPHYYANDAFRIEIDPQLCRGCSKCARNCHAGAITGVIKSPYVIDPEKCVKCYNCIENCPFDAIREVHNDG